MDEKFKFEDDTKKEQILIEFRELLKEKYPKKADMIMNNRYDLEYVNMCADYFNINILCIDCDNNSYQIYSELNSNEQIIILVNSDRKNILLQKFLTESVGKSPNASWLI